MLYFAATFSVSGGFGGTGCATEQLIEKALRFLPETTFSEEFVKDTLLTNGEAFSLSINCATV